MTGLEVFKILKKGQWFDEIEKFGDTNPRFKLFLGIIEKELKALEIIKEKGNFISPEYDENRNKYYIYDNESYEHNEITREEYELLKEIL